MDFVTTHLQAMEALGTVIERLRETAHQWDESEWYSDDYEGESELLGYVRIESSKLSELWEIVNPRRPVYGPVKRIFL